MDAERHQHRRDQSLPDIAARTSRPITRLPTSMPNGTDASSGPADPAGKPRSAT